MSGLKDKLLNHDRHDYIRFFEEPHEYFYYPSGDFRKTKERVQYNGVTGWIGSFKKDKFVKKDVAKSCNANPNSKYYGWGEDEIIAHWDAKRDKGSAIHKAIEDVVNLGVYDNDMAFYIDSFFEEVDRIGVDPFVSEIVLYDEDIERATPMDVCGTRKDRLVPMDIKTYSDGITFTGYGGKTLKHPLGDLYDSKYTSVSLQISIERKWLLEKYGFKGEDIEDGYVLILNDQGCEAIPVMNYIAYVDKMIQFETPWEE